MPLERTEQMLTANCPLRRWQPAAWAETGNRHHFLQVRGEEKKQSSDGLSQLPLQTCDSVFKAHKLAVASTSGNLERETLQNFMTVRNK